MSWLEEMSKAYEARPIIKITPDMVTAGMQALDGGLQDTADLVFRTMMQGQPPMEVTTRMKQTGAEVMFKGVDFDADRLAAQILLVMFQEARLHPAWTSKYSPERAIPRAIEMLGEGAGEIVQRDDSIVLVLKAQSPMAEGLSHIGPRYIWIGPEAVAHGRQALYSGWETTVEKVFRAVLTDNGINVSAKMKEAGLNMMAACEGQEDDWIVANVMSEMLGAWGYRTAFTAGGRAAPPEDQS